MSSKSSTMASLAGLLLLIHSLHFSWVLCGVLSWQIHEEQASHPPRGWNSYDSFSWVVSEEEFMQNADVVSKRLLQHGYEYVVVDYLWYRRKVERSYTDASGYDVIDEWGRLVPDPGRWPSSVGGKGFTEVAKKVHQMGLKFGIHVMRGLSFQAFNASTPILDIDTGGAYVESGRQWRASDIGKVEMACAWMSHGFMSIDTGNGAGRAFLRSLYHQYAEWGVDFVKHDCVFGRDLDLNEISMVSEILKELDRPILYSLSPGVGATPLMAKDVAHLVNMYRITGDDWDTWSDVEAHFDVARDFASSNLIGSEGLRGKSWPDLDMLPMGWLSSVGSNEGPYRKCNLSIIEQKTQMTLWSMAKSPLIFGGDLRQIDKGTLSIITHPILLEINFHSSNNMEFPYITTTGSLNNCKRFLGKISRSLKSENLNYRTELIISSCKDQNARNWVIGKRPAELCWKTMSRENAKYHHCLNKKISLSNFSVSDQVALGKHYKEKFHLVVEEPANYCLDAAADDKTSSTNLKKSSFSPCMEGTKQMWELNLDGTLKSSYSGLCAKIEAVEDKSSSDGGRSWIATGRRGEIYLSFFNLNSDTSIISAKIKDLVKSVPANYLGKGSCKCYEVWGAEHCRIRDETITKTLDGHGAALFMLICT